MSIAGVLLCTTLTRGHDWGDDFSAYIMQARSLVEGNPREFCEANRFTIQHSSWGIGPVAYPWGYPVLLAPLYAAFGVNMIALKLVGALSFLIFLPLLFIGFRKYHSPFWLLCLVCLFSLNPTLLAFSDHILSDMPFLLCSTFTVLLTGTLIVERRRLISPVCDRILLGASMAVSFFIRTNGLLLLITLGITQFIVLAQRRWRAGISNADGSTLFNSFIPRDRAAAQGYFLAFLPYAIFLSSTALWSAVFPEGGSSHMNDLRQISVHSIVKNLRYYIILPADFFDGAPFCHLLYAASVPCVIVGVIRRYRSDYHIITYLILTFLLLILWPSIQGLRFLFPALPFYMSFMMTGVEAFQTGTTAAGISWRRVASVLTVFLVLSFFGIRSIGNAYSNITHHRETSCGPFIATSKSMFSFIRQDTEPGSTVVFFKPRVMRMMTGRTSFMTTKTADLSSVDYLCLYLGQDAYNQVSPDAISDYSRQGSAQLIFENIHFRVYRLTKDRTTSRIDVQQAPCYLADSTHKDNRSISAAQ